MSDLESYTTTITAGQSLSDAVPLGVKVLVGLSFDENWTSPTGGVTFQVSSDGVTFQEYYDGVAGTEILVPASAAKSNQFVAMSNINQWGAVKLIKVRSGTAAAPVNQSSTTTITVFVQ